MTNVSAIAQTYLTKMAETVMSGDFDSYRSGIVFPFTHATADGEREICDEDTLRKGFDEFRDMLQKAQADTYSQTVLRAIDLKPDRLAAHFEAEILSNDHPVVPRYRNWITLRQVAANHWCASAVTSHFANRDRPVQMPWHRKPGNQS